MVIWEIRAALQGQIVGAFTFRFDYKPCGNDLLIAIALTEDGMPDCPNRKLLRAIRYRIPADLEIIEDGRFTSNEVIINSTSRFVFTKVDTDPESRVQNLPGEGQPDGSEGMPKVFYSDGFREQILAQKRLRDDGDGRQSEGVPQGDGGSPAVGESDPFAERW